MCPVFLGRTQTGLYGLKLIVGECEAVRVLIFVGLGRLAIGIFNESLVAIDFFGKFALGFPARSRTVYWCAKPIVGRSWTVRMVIFVGLGRLSIGIFNESLVAIGIFGEIRTGLPARSHTVFWTENQ